MLIGCVVTAIDEYANDNDDRRIHDDDDDYDQDDLEFGMSFYCHFSSHI